MNLFLAVFIPIAMLRSFIPLLLKNKDFLMGSNFIPSQGFSFDLCNHLNNCSFNR